MKFFEKNICLEEEFIPIKVSDSFKKELNRALTVLLKPHIENYVDMSKMIMSFENFPVEEVIGMKCDSFHILNPYNFSVEGVLYWKSVAGNSPIGILDEIEKGSLEFWIENKHYDFMEWLLVGLKKNAELRQKFYLEGYKFVLELQTLSIDSVIKIYFNEPLDEDLRDKTEQLLYSEVARFNDNEDNGIIHSIDLVDFKKNKYLKFNIDFGSSDQAGLDLLFNTLNNSGFDIRKVEIKGRG